MEEQFKRRVRQESDEQARLERLAERLRRRVGRAIAMLGEESNRYEREGHTERMHRLLVLWLDLDKAMGHFESGRGRCPPWESAHPKVRTVWNKLTAPANRFALEQWLCQAAEGRPAEWARKALEECRARSATSDLKSEI